MRSAAGLLGALSPNLSSSGFSDKLGLSRVEYDKAVADGAPSCSIGSIPDHSGHPVEIIDDNRPCFSEEELRLAPGYESYADLDGLGRVGAALALVGAETMPAEGESRKTIKHVVPSGWSGAAYDFIAGGKLYNRCHLIGYGLTAEQDNAQNLFTGTSYMNSAMRVFENMAASHCRATTGNRVLFRATPVFRGNELVARGVQLEALSVQDGGDAVRFHVFLYNVQPAVRIDHATGASCADPSVRDEMLRGCVLNERTKVFHRATCPSAQAIAEGGAKTFNGMRGELAQQGYAPCARCRP